MLCGHFLSVDVGEKARVKSLDDSATLTLSPEDSTCSRYQRNVIPYELNPSSHCSLLRILAHYNLTEFKAAKGY